MKFLLVILGLLVLGSLFLYKMKPTDEFEEYKRVWGKSYNNLQIDEYRRAIFYENKAKIEAWNAQPNKDHTEAVNMFTDLTQEEFEKTYLGLETQPKSGEFHVSTGAPTNDIDWTKKGAPFDKVKDQGACGSCWAFSAVGGLEGINAITFPDKIAYFSEQQLVDCSKSYGNHGCNGGLMTYAYKYVIDKGITSEEKYPYVAYDQTCKIDSGDFTIAKYTEIKNCKDQEEALQKQPVAIAADASRWSSYSGGIFSNCGTSLNHGITLVGVYTNDGYWKVKNSWGARWGENGFIRLKYPGSTCGCCNMSCYPQDPKWK